MAELRRRYWFRDLCMAMVEKVKRGLRIGLDVLGGLVVLWFCLTYFAPGFVRHTLLRRPSLPSEIPAFTVSETFPELKLNSGEGEVFRFSDYPHKAVLVNFFTSW